MSDDATYFGEDLYGRTLWQRLVEHKERSASLERRQSLILGVRADTGEEIALQRELLHSGHMHITGGTGAGKTSATITPLLLQLIRGYRDADGQPAPPSPIVVFDLKGDRALFHAVRHACQLHHRVFRFLSIRSSDDYYFFDPFQMFRWSELEPIELADKFLRGLMLDYGITYGPSYFTSQNLGVLTEALEIFLANGRRTLARLARIVSKVARAKKNFDARHVDKCISLLAQYPQVDITQHAAPPARQIDMFRAVDEGEVILFHLNMQDRAPSARPLAGLAIYTLEEAVKARAAQNRPEQHTYVVIDEFHYIAGQALGELVSTVRDWGLHLVLANQATGQLKAYDPYLAEVIRKSTVVEQYFTPGRDTAEIEHLQQASGLKLEYLEGWSESQRGWFRRLNPQKTEALSLDTIYANSDEQLASLVILHDGVVRAPAERVQPVQGLYPIPKAQWQAYRAPLPSRPRPTPPPSAEAPPRESRTNSRAKTTATAPQSPAAQGASGEPRPDSPWQGRMRACWERLERDEGRATEGPREPGKLF